MWRSLNMPHPMKIEGASAEIGGIGGEGKVRLKGNLNANISNRQSQEIFQQVNQNLGSHPNNHKPINQNSANQSQNNPEHAVQTNGEQFPQNSENTVIKGNGNGSGNAYGHERGRGRGGEHNQKPQNNPNQPPDLIVHNQTSNNSSLEKPINNHLSPKPTNQVNENLNQNQSVNNNPVQLQNNSSNSHGKSNNWENNHGFQNRNENRGHNFSNNQSNNFAIIVVKQVFQNNDIHLSNNDVRKLVGQDNFQSQNSLPPELKSLLQNINERTLNFLKSSAKFTGKTAHQLATDISRQFHEQINSVKNNLLQNVNLNAKHFNQTNIHEKMHIAIELMPKHLSANDGLNLQNIVLKKF
ncbi:MAG: hypothetical protein HC846_12470 [Blastocatellia bacterium]|nr:hypothetical protein [Blastocatellia bacterium]